ncbi:Alpha carbonic anhydrase 7 [Linum grandiflorum]
MEFDYVEDGERGPSRWGEIHPEWHTCSNGTMQSPIDILYEKVDVAPELGMLRRSYKAVNSTLMNRGHDIMMRFEGGGGSLEINGSEYMLNQIHWHSPSEHTINGRRYAMEAHLVHETSDGRRAVVAILYTIGWPDLFLDSMKHHLVGIAGKEEQEVSVGVMNPIDIRIESRSYYYRYMGSLTVPPCTENVIWTIVSQIRTVSHDQLKLLRVAVHDVSFYQSFIFH